MLRKKENSTLVRMEDCENKAYLCCRDEIRAWVHDFYIKCIHSPINWNEDTLCAQNIEKLFHAFLFFVESISKYENLKENDLQNIKKIIEELENVLSEIIPLQQTSVSAVSLSKFNLMTKIEFLSEIFYKNGIGMKCFRAENDKHKGKIFENYSNLYIIIKMVNARFDELFEKGLSLQLIWHYFCEVSKTKVMNEEEKLEMLMGLINGTMKFQPIYEYRIVGYDIKPIEFCDTIVINGQTPYNTPFLEQQNKINSKENIDIKKKKNM